MEILLKIEHSNYGSITLCKRTFQGIFEINTKAISDALVKSKILLKARSRATTTYGLQKVFAAIHCVCRNIML